MTLCDVSLYNTTFLMKKNSPNLIKPEKKKIPFFLDVMNLLNE